VKIAHLRHFVVAAEVLHFPRAAEALNISRAKLGSSITALEAEAGASLFDRTGETRLTPAGAALLRDARIELAEFDASGGAAPWVPPKAGGKAKANKGQGRTPAVKGAPKPKHQRQGR